MSGIIRVLSHSVVFGYGAIIPAEDFNEVFPGSFLSRPFPNLNRYQPINLPYIPHISFTDQYFLGTHHVFIHGTEVGFVAFKDGAGLFYDNQQDDIDMEKVNKQKEIIDKFIQENFPKAEVGYKLFAYEELDGDPFFREEEENE